MHIKQQLDSIDSYGGQLSVHLINNQPDESDQVTFESGRVKYVANYNEWTQFFVDVWTIELKKRGVNVSPESPNKILVKLSDFSTEVGFAIVKENVLITLKSSDGSWSKVHNGYHKMGLQGTDDSVDAAVLSSMVAFLKDSEVIDQMKDR